MEKIYLYQLKEDKTARSYDEAFAAAAMQGLINREGAKVYLVCEDDEVHRKGQPGYDVFGAPVDRPRSAPWFWLDKMSEDGRWLEGRERIVLKDLTALYELAKPYLRGIVLWDPSVPATVNVATTAAGVENLLPMTEALYETFGKKTGLPVLLDLRGKFDGKRSGSKKVDAYLWAIENYLEKGLCSEYLVGNFNDSWRSRDLGWTTYVLERDRFVNEKAFCFELSPWDTFAPEDDPDEPLGIEKETMLRIFRTVFTLSGGRHMTEFCGFFNWKKLEKGQTNGVLSEWEQVWLMTPYNFYQNTVTNDVYNQSFHKWAPKKDLKQGRPKEKKELENKVYVCMQVCDMDSTTPLYDTMIGLWHDPRRGELPLAWGLNPNLSGVFPDLFEYFYDTKTEGDYFCADASAAGYFNPVVLPQENWDAVVKHCKYWYDHTDMTISGMVLDVDHPTSAVLKNYAKFSPDGFSSLVSNYHGGKNLRLDRQVVNGMPMTYMTLAVCDWLGSPKKTAEALSDWYFREMSPNRPEFLYYRLCYRNPGEMYDLFYELQRQNPGLTLEMVDPYTYFDLVKQDCVKRAPVFHTLRYDNE